MDYKELTENEVFVEITAVGGETYSVSIGGVFTRHFECPAINNDAAVIKAACKNFNLKKRNYIFEVS